ncbi:MAG: hypothetical protein ABEK10_02500 [Candidatus Nanosalina sp.]
MAVISLDPESFTERNYPRADEVSEEVDQLYLAVHPGFALENDEYQDLGLRAEDHFRFTYSFFNEFRDRAESGYRIAVLEETGSSYSREFLGELSDEVDHWFETNPGNAKIRYSNADEFIELVYSLADGAEVLISGELNNLCQAQAWQIVDHVAEEEEKNLDMSYGESFPSRPLIREDGELRFCEDDSCRLGH